MEEKQKAVAVAQQQEREFELEKLKIQLEMQKLSQAPVVKSYLNSYKRNSFTNKVISFMMADGIRQTITALRTIIDLYIEGKVIPTEFLVLPEAKGNKTLLGLDFLNAAGIVLDDKGGKWHFSDNPRKQYKFFSKTLEDLNISAFDLREDEAKHLSREQTRKLSIYSLTKMRHASNQGESPHRL
ncbi:hypothetical protein TNCT_575501 [Trichonephila clavata]|uniref:Uncharacterized protein n=1 Tax=Trichonephila clavata TaxID=2740835 RepID=A0A8X6JMJ6_TRICU|nr:hypothetical protein TNCT_575501 [Trichonephila clavata]